MKPVQDAQNMAIQHGGLGHFTLQAPDLGLALADKRGSMLPVNCECMSIKILFTRNILY